MTTDMTRSAVLDRMRATEPQTTQEVPEVTASDRDELITITLDSARRVTAVRVADVSRLRTPYDLSRALIGAFQAADGERALLSLDAQGTREEFLERVERDFSDNPGLRVPRVRDVSYAAYQRGELGRPTTSREPSPAAGVSDNGYLRIQRGADGMLLVVDADAEWLAAARPEFLEDAIVQAADYDVKGD